MSPQQSAEPPLRRGNHRALLEFLFAFCCVFAGLALPSGCGPVYVRMHAALGNALVEDAQLESGVALRFSSTRDDLSRNPWHATLHIVPRLPATPVQVPIDFRGLMFLPTAVFIALTLAAPLGSARRNLKLLLVGVLLLEVLLLLLVATPLLSFLGGTGPIRAFDLSRPSHVVLQIVYRALVAPPGMAFAIPLLLWWILVARAGGFRISERALRIPAAMSGETAKPAP